MSVPCTPECRANRERLELEQRLTRAALRADPKWVRLEILRRAKDPDYHHCSCMWLRENAGKKGRRTRGDGTDEVFTFPNPPRDCGWCDNTGWIT